MEKKISNLIHFCQGILKNENGKALYERYLKDIREVTPKDVFLVQNEQLKRGTSPAQILKGVDKIINAFYESLTSYTWDKPEEGSFLYYLMAENKGMIGVLDAFKPVMKSDTDVRTLKNKCADLIETLYLYNDHLLKLENILFPNMEKKQEQFEGLKIMWALHDEVRTRLKATSELLSRADITTQDIKIAVSELFFDMHGMVQKQELIMFPAASEMFSADAFASMHIQSFDYAFPYIDQPEKPAATLYSILSSTGVLQTPTGSLSHEMIELVINTMPVDITVIDENDKVAFFSRPKDRLFPRSPAVIGRDVRNCHPPKSVHIVEEILASFREGSRDSASFWIKLKGLYVLIQYFALRNEHGEYKGTLEVGQEISEIQAIEGEKRLLD